MRKRNSYASTRSILQFSSAVLALTYKMDVKYIQLSVLAAITLCFTFLTQRASAIECFECSSKDPDPNIAEKCKNSPGSLTSLPQYYKNCSDASKRCRKITQEVDKDERIIRQCAIAVDSELGCLKRTGTYKIKMEYCECDADGCNSAFNTHVSIATVFSIFMGILLCVFL
ncbi:UPAR/Ly6 domain-containing protein crok-like [Crassostrea virginica]